MIYIKYISKIVLTGILLLEVFLFSCTEEEVQTKIIKPTITNLELGNDFSYANTKQVTAEQLHLDLDINFSNKSIYGVARYRLKRHFSDTILFDINGLQIQKVTLGKIGNEKNTDYVIGMEDSIHGAPLSIKIKKHTRFVNIYYQTTEAPTNLHWEIDSTSPKNNLLYTIPGERYTRNWIPIQDVSNHKLDFSIEIQNDCNLTPIFGSELNLHQLDSNRFFYESPIKLAVYDIGFFLGDFRSEKINKNITIYTLNQFTSTNNSNEFIHFNTCLNALKSIYNSHPWKEFNFCILPPKFPYKSYDYPYLSFVHPVSLSKSQNSGDFILEYLFQTWPYPLFSTKCEKNRQLAIGMNRYLSIRSKAALLGKDYFEMLIKTHIEQNRKSYYTQNIPLIRLRNVYSKPCDEKIELSYHDRMNFQLKGFLFFLNIENKFGKIEFENFLKSFYLKPSQNNQNNFESKLNLYLTEHNITDFNTYKWLENSKITRQDLTYDSKRYEIIHKSCRIFSYQRKFSKLKKFKKLVKKYTIDDWFTFISLLPKGIDKEKLDFLDEKYHFSTHPHRSIQRLWFSQCIRLGYLKPAQVIIEFLTHYGEVESNYQLYELMLNQQSYRELAVECFKKNESTLSNETRKALKPLFQRFIQ